MKLSCNLFMLAVAASACCQLNGLLGGEHTNVASVEAFVPSSISTRNTNNNKVTTIKFHAWKDDDENHDGGHNNNNNSSSNFKQQASAALKKVLATATMTAAVWAGPALLADQASVVLQQQQQHVATSSTSNFMLERLVINNNNVANAVEKASGTGSRVNKDAESLLRLGLPIKNKEVRFNFMVLWVCGALVTTFEDYVKKFLLVVFCVSICCNDSLF